jgi:hypothetical protein
MEVNYKAKYHALRLKFMDSMDMAFRLGYEQGGKDAQVDQAVQAAADAQAAAAGAQGQVDAEGNPIGGDEGGQPGEEGGQPPGQGAPGQEGAQPPGQGQPPGAGAPNSSELDQHIAKLESIVSAPGGASANPEATEEIKKSVAGITDFYRKQHAYVELQKSQKAISAIVKAVNGPAKHNFKLNQVASHNLDSNQKVALSMQEKVVKDVMAKWEQQEAKAEKAVSNILSVEGLKKD